MAPLTENISGHWVDLMVQMVQEANALALGVFSLDGQSRYMNAGMKQLLAFDETKGTTVKTLVNPSFEQLTAECSHNDLIFEGILTAGDRLTKSVSTRAKVFRRGDELLVAAEYDVAELDLMNQRMTAMNREINNLQRQLIKEKTLLEQTLKELQETQAMLIHAEKMNAMGQLVAGVAHEVNNPIGFVISNLYSLKDCFSDVWKAYDALETLFVKRDADQGEKTIEALRQEHDLEFIFEDFPDLIKGSLDGALRIKEIVQKLRIFSRLDEAERKAVDVAESLRSTLSLADSELRKRAIKVNLKLNPMDPLECYPSELNQVFMNLIVNSAQAMTGGGELTIRALQDEKWVTLEFEDTGPGIPKDIQDKIFNPFFTTKPVGSGTGLGLSLAYQIITHKHKGSISFYSGEKIGAGFRIRIPRRF